MPSATQHGTSGLAGLLAVDAGAAGAAARALVHDGVGIEATELELSTVAYPIGSPTTGGLFRLEATDASGDSATLFCKIVQHVRHWPMIAMLPPAAAAQLQTIPWRTELELWDAVVQQSLPGGRRRPALYRMVDLGDDRAAVWQEDVAADATPWDLASFARAAELIGRWNARCTQADLLATSPYPSNHGLRMYATQAVLGRGLPPLADDDLWSHPWLRDHEDLRARLRELATGIPAMLDRLDTLPQTLPHGDASPQNLLRSTDGDLVAIDLSFRTPHTLGFDLGQLLVGLVHAGEQPAARLPEIAATIVPAYLGGVRAAGLDVDESEVREAFATSVLLRSGFDGFRYDLLAAPPSEIAKHAFEERVLLSRFLVEHHAVLGAG